jgi:hypothetical protein
MFGRGFSHDENWRPEFMGIETRPERASGGVTTGSSLVNLGAGRHPGRRPAGGSVSGSFDMD